MHENSRAKIVEISDDMLKYDLYETTVQFIYSN